MGLENGCRIIGSIDPEILKKTVRKKTLPKQHHEELLVPEDTYELAQSKIRENKIDEREFSRDYGEMTEKDIAEAERLKNEFLSSETEEEKELHKFAEILEAMLVDFLNSCEWLGKGTRAMNTADFDDFKNKIDIIAELVNEKGYKKHLGLAIDASFSNDLDNKFDEIRKKIINGELSELKYFKSENITGRLKNIPRVVIGVSLGTIKELGKLWTNGDIEAIKNHPVQFQILDEMILQLETYQKYSTKYNKHDLSRVYKEGCDTLKEIKAEKEKSVVDTGERDHVFKKIESRMNNLLSR